MRTKEIILTGLMMLLLAACSGGSDNLGVPEPTTGGTGGHSEPVGQGPVMGFSAVFADDEGGEASSRTRGANRRTGEESVIGKGEFTNADLQASGFGVYCWYTGKTDYESGHIKDYTENILMLNQRVEYKNDLWTYSPAKYWPLDEDEKLTFRAYAPYVSYQLQTSTTTGLPLLPVVVTKDDYHNGTQHDPLWGTAKYGGNDGDEGTKYGVLYNNYTYQMSGTTTAKDAYDGTVYWYFHHGMSKLMFTVSVIQDPGCEKVTIQSIKIEGLYKQGLLDLSSPTTQSTDKPFWYECSGDMSGEEGAVKLNGATKEDDTWIPGDLAPIPEPDPTPEGFSPYPFVINIDNPSEPTPYIPLLSYGLLIIPRNFEASGMNITVTYTIDNDEETVLPATATIKKNFQGNTAYMLGLSLTPSTQGLEITMVQSAFTDWADGGTMERWVYNW